MIGTSLLSVRLSRAGSLCANCPLADFHPVNVEVGESGVAVKSFASDGLADAVLRPGLTRRVPQIRAKTFRPARMFDKALLGAENAPHSRTVWRS